MKKYYNQLISWQYPYSIVDHIITGFIENDIFIFIFLQYKMRVIVKKKICYNMFLKKFNVIAMPCANHKTVKFK